MYWLTKHLELFVVVSMSKAEVKKLDLDSEGAEMARSSGGDTKSRHLFQVQRKV
jgi:hypothetical protein